MWSHVFTCCFLFPCNILHTGIDVCQRLSGVALKLAAFDKMLADNGGAKKGDIVLIQKSILTGNRPGDKQTTATDVRKVVNDINGKYTTTAAERNAYNQSRRDDETPEASSSSSSVHSNLNFVVDPAGLFDFNFLFELTVAS